MDAKKNREKFTIDITKRTLYEQEVINKWLDSQKNIQDSVVTLIDLIRGKYGEVDIKALDIQRKIYSDFMSDTQDNSTETKIMMNDHEVEIRTSNIISQDEFENTNSNTNANKNSQTEDELDIDINKFI